MERQNDNLKNQDNTFDSSNMSSDLTDNKNTTLKKIQFYLTLIVGTILILLMIFSLVKSLFNGGEEKQEVDEVKVGSVKALNKIDFKDETPTFPTFEDIIRPAEEKPVIVEDDIFPVIPKKVPPTPKIIKGATTAMVNSGGDGNPLGGILGKGGSSGTNKYQDYINELEQKREALTNTENDTGSNTYDGETFSPMAATINQFDPDLLLPKGTYIGCSLDTRFVSSIQGSTACTVSQNVFSSNGNVLLIEKGSKLFGTFKGAQANDGTSRYFVVWQEVRTPNHLRIPLNSGASDELGGSGLEGEIDHKWMLRFGSSIMLSMIDDAFNILAWKLTQKQGGDNKDRGSNVDYSENTRENVNDMASIALEKFINLQPTIYKQHGDLVGVYVNRDIDFSKVYKLTKKNKDK